MRTFRPLKGQIEIADEGTLFFDEIGELSLDSLVKLLRFLQNGEIRRIGAVASTKVDVRVVAATHRDLPTMVRDGYFCEDLYYRLNIIPLTLPPLHDRRERTFRNFYDSSRSAVATDMDART